MGDMADYYLDNGLDEGWWWGGTPHRDARGGPRPAFPGDVVCKRCGKRGLKWRDAFTGWRLFEGDKAHVCGPDPSTDFD